MGYCKSYKLLGDIYNYDKENTARAIQAYQEGAEHGDIMCYPCLGRIYMQNDAYGKENNAIRAWGMFFSNIHSVIETDNDLTPILGEISSYIHYSLLLEKGIDDKYIPIFTLLKHDLLDFLNNLDTRYRSMYKDVVNYLSLLDSD